MNQEIDAQPARRRGLGRGLGALITAPAEPLGGPSVVPVASIQPNPEQPRRRFVDEELRALADSIGRHGVLQPLLVTRSEGGFILVAGERRLRAAAMAGLAEVPVLVRGDTPRDESLALALVENIQRHDLNPLEEAEAFQQLVDEFGRTHEEIGRQVGKTRSHVSNAIRLLGLAPALRAALLSGAISAGHGRAVAALPAPDQEELLRRVLRDELSVRETESLAGEIAQAPGGARRPPRASAIDPEWQALESRFRDALQTRVKLQRGRRGGRLVIEFYSDEELESLFRRIVVD